MTRFVKTQIIVLIALLCAASPALAQRGRFAASNLRDGREVRTAFQSIASAADAATVRVLCNGKEAALGAIVGPEGWVITKYSELREPIVCRLSDGRQLAARIVGHEPQFDLAMLKLEASGLKTIDWANDDYKPAVGQLIATAAPGDMPLAVGVVSVPPREIPPRAGMLGIHLDQADKNPQITAVFAGSAAEQAGLKVGDLVLRVADKPIDTTEKLVDTIHKYKPGDTVSLRVQRGESSLNIDATLMPPGEVGPTSRSERMNAMGGPLSRRSADFPSVIQHDTVLRPTDCGGPVVDLSGKVVGINIARAGRTESYAVPADRVRQLLDDLKSGRLAPNNPLPGTKEKKVEQAKAG